MSQRAKNVCIGLYLLICGGWNLCVCGYELFYCISVANTPGIMDVVRSWLHIVIGGFARDILWIVSGVMCISAVFVRKGGKYIVIAGIIGFAASLIPAIIAVVFYGAWRQMIRLIVPIGIIVCGWYWGHHQNGSLYWFPFFRNEMISDEMSDTPNE
ncbi:hypothetical protein LJC33_09225 [Eubacteriales bacterium OttesenSCG-928-N13]|nr:hypothetical protein [Eubacteriales bacterium OttesenSCG-928-N13]